MKLPWICPACGHESMVDLDHLDEWQVDKLTTAQGYICENCRDRQIITVTTPILREAEKTFSRYSPTHPKFQFLFAKLLRKISGMLNRLPGKSI